MHPYVVDRLVQERQQEVRRLRRRNGSGDDVAAWRRRAGRALLSLTVAVGVPRARRTPVRGSASALLGLGCGPETARSTS